MNAQAEDEKKNKLKEFRGFGQWEVWCIDIAQSGTVECNLNQVLRYKNHPDFRALIPRIYTREGRVDRLVIDREWQTSLSRGFIQVDNNEPISLSWCRNPCVITGILLAKIVQQFSSGENATIRIHDYFVQQFDVNISLNNFPAALEALQEMQSRY